MALTNNVGDKAKFCYESLSGTLIQYTLHILAVYGKKQKMAVLRLLVDPCCCWE